MPEPTSPGTLLAPWLFRERLLAAMRIPIIEAAFSHPWTAAARRRFAQSQSAVHGDGDVGAAAGLVRAGTPGGVD